jgi:uncharacterized membrane protein YphA (DoxX/SURF4 family)
MDTIGTTMYLKPSKAATIAGWVLSVLPCLMLLFSGTMKFMGGEELEKGFAHLGWPVKLAVTLGVIEVLCTVLYLVPKTAVLGAILLTGYLGGAIATHLRLEEGVIIQFLLGVVLWLGLFLRDTRLRALIPFVRSPK